MMNGHDVYVARVDPVEYSEVAGACVPELREGIPVTTSLLAMRTLFCDAGLDRDRFGSSSWNPLSDLVQEGNRVVLKPNWVFHSCRSERNLDALVTHTDVIAAVLAYLEKVARIHVVVGDAPIQGCDFDRLLKNTGAETAFRRFEDRFETFDVVDFRRTVRSGTRQGGTVHRGVRPLDRFVLFDLGSDSLVEPITDDRSEFRVTMYNPDDLAKTHAPGRHQYLIAREVIDADVVFNLPKLKTHKKAGITGALKNTVGINGHKEYLPHHRRGGSGSGGDCYPGSRPLKGCAERLLDSANRRESQRVPHYLRLGAAVLARVDELLGGNRDVEGSWHGNDTVWRMALDLQRILYYGRADGSLGQKPVRTVISISDAVVAGEGNGPLSPSAVPLGLLTMGASTATVEYVNSRLMKLDPDRIPIVREALRGGRWPLVDAEWREPKVSLDGRTQDLVDVEKQVSRAFRPANGWVGQCEL